MSDKRPINPDWEDYYNTLEEIRSSGICNMWEGDKYLRVYYPKLDKEQSTEILLNWIDNYNDLTKLYHWRDVGYSADKIQDLNALGFGRHEATEALKKVSWNVKAAKCYLLMRGDATTRYKIDGSGNKVHWTDQDYIDYAINSIKD